MRYTSGRSASLTHTFHTDDESVFLTPVTVTVTVTRQGATVPAYGPVTATLSGTVYTVSAGLLPQGVYTVLWNGTTAVDTTTIEVVGGHLFTLSELRAADVDLSVQRYPSAVARQARDFVAQEIESITGRSPVPRTVRVPWLTGEPLPRMDVQTVSLWDSAGTAVTPGTLERVGPFSFLPDVTTEAVYTAELDYGFRIVPDDLREAALLRAKDILFEANSGIPDRATSFQPGDGGTYILSTAGRRGALTGIPDVDAVLARYSFPLLDGIGGFW